MDPATTALLGEAAKLSFVVLLLLVAVVALVRWVRRLETERDLRETEARNQCAGEVAELVTEVRRLQDERHTESRLLINQCMGVLQTNSQAFCRLVDLEQRRTPTGQHPAIKGN